MSVTRNSNQKAFDMIKLTVVLAFLSGGTELGTQDYIYDGLLATPAACEQVYTTSVDQLVGEVKESLKKGFDVEVKSHSCVTAVE